MSFKGRQTMDHERVSFNLARLKKGGMHFEVAIDPDLAVEFRKGKNVDIKEVIKSEKIFHDVKKGVFAEHTHLNELFGTDNILEIAKRIIMEGEIQLTEEYRTKITEEKRKKIIFLISRNALDPQTKLPHPPARIESAMEEAKVRINDTKTAEEQVDDIIKKLRIVLPIRIEKKKINIKVPPEFAGKAYGTIAQFAAPQNEKWHSDGSYECDVEIPAGLEPDLYERLNHMTHGGVHTKVME